MERVRSRCRIGVQKLPSHWHKRIISSIRQQSGTHGGDEGPGEAKHLFVQESYVLFVQESHEPLIREAVIRKCPFDIVS